MFGLCHNCSYVCEQITKHNSGTQYSWQNSCEVNSSILETITSTGWKGSTDQASTDVVSISTASHHDCSGLLCSPSDFSLSTCKLQWPPTWPGLKTSSRNLDMCTHRHSTVFFRILLRVSFGLQKTLCQMFLVSPNQECQSTERNLQH